ncbi:MAG: hypothetical protein AB1757_04030 [Acidobacteriota bacterium]
MTNNLHQIFEQSYIEALSALINGKRQHEVIVELIGKGFSQEDAGQIVGEAQRAKKAAFRKAGAKAFFAGLALLVLGVVITAASYSAAKNGGIYIVTIGLFITGAINLLKGFFRMLVG